MLQQNFWIPPSIRILAHGIWLKWHWEWNLIWLNIASHYRNERNHIEFALEFLRRSYRFACAHDDYCDFTSIIKFIHYSSPRKPQKTFPNFLSFPRNLSTMAIAKNPTKTTPKKKEGIFGRALTVTWEQFTSTTTIHGLKHVNDPRGNRYTKLFWILVPIFCFICAIALMATFLMRYKSVSFWN